MKNKIQLKKEYNIYFHDDFDGFASASVIYDFLIKFNSKVKSFNPVNYDLKNKWPNFKFKPNPIILDFYYHPQASFWFDHHKTSFINQEWQKKFKPTPYHHFNTKYKSCCSLVINKLKKYFNYQPSKKIKNLSKWLDIIDGANYKSAYQTIALKEPPLQIDAFIDGLKKPPLWLIKKLPYFSLKEIANLDKIKKFIIKEKKRREKLLNYYYKNLKIYDNKIAFIDKTKISGSLRYAPFYFNPNLIYNIILRKHKLYIITVGVNPWKRNKNKIHIGNFLRQNFGGGGHKTVGGAEFKTKKEAMQAVEKIIQTLK